MKGTLRLLRHLSALIAELFRFAWREKVYWILPFALVILLLSFLVVSGQAATPFIYTLF